MLAWGLFRRDGWAQPAGWVLGVAHLPVVPTGSLVGLYTLWVVRQRDVRRLLESSDAARVASRLSVGGRAIVGTWLVSAVAVGGVIGGLRWAAPPLTAGVPVAVAAIAPAPVEVAPVVPEPPRAAARSGPVEWWEYRPTERDVIVVERYDDIPAAHRGTARRLR